MSQTLLAPSPAVIRPFGAQDLRRAAPADPGLPFARPQAVTPGGWLAGLVFGLVCLGAGAVLVVACLLAVVVLAVVGLVRPSRRPLGGPVRRPAAGGAGTL